ncbi:hypothetical protein, unlikely [Trypanosoma brucei gambiense DAL972]|uniref:Uncharacterized protein n=1 Tax=Trypanosoma brucei gambiense (strain MHOM/CI/86/DAL972) TaxID=679716 RepID=D0A3W3_TRYB9|nr:hypothetical protein, unlikely [Trypanosoma brucei gambiense DAL972]CBH15957.1 hypothetical protein, unlikely [Trypanosoma brucei gambiense DAL972]|eukprot:XP_011778221.1 hypothetical protein, unlikely [Trypanosoma brucei gambiense DAL972]
MKGDTQWNKMHQTPSHKVGACHCNLPYEQKKPISSLLKTSFSAAFPSSWSLMNGKNHSYKQQRKTLYHDPVCIAETKLSTRHVCAHINTYIHNQERPQHKTIPHAFALPLL